MGANNDVYIKSGPIFFPEIYKAASYMAVGSLI
jgi:hypothetical protein